MLKQTAQSSLQNANLILPSCWLKTFKKTSTAFMTNTKHFT